MGYYINEINGKVLPHKGKADFIIKNVEGAKVITPPIEWQEDIVCVVENLHFDAAGYAYDTNEMHVFITSGVHRPRTWLYVPGAKEYAK